MSFLKNYVQFSAEFLRDKLKKEILIQWQPIQTNFLVLGSPVESRILVYHRQNKHSKEILLPNPCSHMAWSRDGLFLALACPKDQVTPLFIWSPGSQKLINQDFETWDTGAVTWMGWSPTADILAVSYSTGNTILLDKTSDKKTVVRGHHASDILDGAWSNDGILASSSIIPSESEDRPTASRITFVTSQGDKALTTRECSYGPVRNLQFTTSKFVSTGVRQQNTLCCVANRKTLVLFNLNDEMSSLQYSFKSDYGSIVEYTWFGDGYVLLCFQKGVLIWVSSHPDEQGKELQHLNIFQTKITHMAATLDGSRFAVCSFGTIKVFQSNIAKMRQSEAFASEGSVYQKMAWTSDGVLLAVVASNGQGVVFLAKIPNIGCSWRNKVATMVSLDMFHVSEILDSVICCGKVSCTFEPTIVALGPNSFVTAVNNLAVFYLAPIITEHEEEEPPEYVNLGKFEYSGIIQAIELSWKFVAVVLTDGRLIIHELHVDPGTFVSHVESTLTTVPGLNDVSCISLSDKNLYFGTTSGHIGYIGLPELKFEVALQHTAGITAIFVKEQDALISYIDAGNDVTVYCLINYASLKVTDFDGKPQEILYDWSEERGGDFASNFIISDGAHVQSYVFVQTSISGSFLEEVKDESGSTEILDPQEALLCFNHGEVAVLSSGILTTRRLRNFPDKIVHEADGKHSNAEVEKLMRLHRYREAVQLCKEDGLKEQLEEIGHRCVRELDMDLAISAFRDGGCYENVLVLERYRNIEHLPRLSGYMALVDNQPELACEWFLKASDPLTVLNIYSDLMQWEKAIDVAEIHAADKMSYACQQHALQLELFGDYPAALSNYEKALTTSGATADAELERACKAGIAKISFRTGDISKGFTLCRELNNPSIIQDCAVILEETRHFKDAGRMYRQCGNLHKAAAMLLKAKEWKPVIAMLLPGYGKVDPGEACYQDDKKPIPLVFGQLLLDLLGNTSTHSGLPRAVPRSSRYLPRISAEEIIEKLDSIPLRLQLAKAKEANGNLKGAVKMYEAAGEYDAVVRLLLDSLNRTDLAIEIVEKTRSQEGAKMVAAHFMRLKDFSSAIRYLLISNRGDEAFLTAQQFQQMDTFAKILGTEQPVALYGKVATYYEDKRDIANAARFYVQANQPQKAVQILMKALRQNSSTDKENAERLEALITATVKCDDLAVTETTTQFLLGHDDGLPKDEKYLLDLYLFSGKCQEADRITQLVADHYLKNGEYRDAHQVLYRTHEKLTKANYSPSGQFLDLFALVHSHAVSTTMYILKQHDKVAHMLIRICNNLSKFPKDGGQFLLSAVLECSRCQMNKSALELALVLMQPEYRTVVTQKYESKILNILRKGDRVTEKEEELTACPHSNHKFPSSALFCPLCKVRVPFCVLTGMHVIRTDFALCPGCRMPVIYSDLKNYLSKGLQSCPMCSTPWSQENVQLCTSEETDKYFQQIDLLRFVNNSTAP